MKDSKPEEGKLKKLIKEFEEHIGHDRKNWRDMIHDFIFWLYEEKEYMIVSQEFELSDNYISDVHLFR